MTREWRVRTFKSGNSVAVRLPKSLGFVEGEDVVMVPHRDGSLSFWKSGEALSALMSLYGAFSTGFMSEGRGDIEQDERNWGDPEREQAA